MPSTAATHYRTQQTSSSLPQLLLRNWLRGRWALLFSQPDDFASYGFEADRWIQQVREAFDAESIAALAISDRRVGDDAGWIGDIGGRFISTGIFGSIVLDSGERGSTHPSVDRRFVIILDGGLEVRHTFFYEGANRLPSPMSLASVAAACRVRAQPMELSSRARLRRDPHS